MTLTPIEAASVLLAAAGVAPGEVPSRRFGADWFREQPPWLAASTVADRLVRDPGFDPTEPLAIAEEILLLPDLPAETAQLVEVGLIESLVCSASHREPADTAALVAALPPKVWQVYHRRRERLEALSEDVRPDQAPPRALEASDQAAALLARCTTYRAESNRHVVLAELISADNPASWSLRHPVVIGLVFAAFLLGFLILSLSTGPPS